MLGLLATGVPWWLSQLRVLTNAFGDAESLSEGAANGFIIGSGWIAIVVVAVVLAAMVIVIFIVDLVSGWSRPVSALLGTLCSIVLIPTYYLMAFFAFSPFPWFYLYVSLGFLLVSVVHVFDVIGEQHRSPRVPPPPYNMQPPPPRPIAGQPPPPGGPNAALGTEQR